MALDDMRADFSISGDIPSPPGARPDFSLFIAGTSMYLDHTFARKTFAQRNHFTSWLK